MSITEMRAKVRAYLDTTKSILARAESENRQLTAAEQKDIEGLEVKTDNLLSTLRTADRVGALRSDPDQPGERTSVTGPFQSLGQQLRAVAQAESPGGQTDERLFEVRAAGLSETIGSEGGFLVQTDFSGQLLRAAGEQSNLLGRCARIPISGSSNGVKLPAIDETSRVSSRFGGILSYWLTEGSEKLPTKPKFRLIELSLKKLVGLCYATDELLQDGSALDAFIRRAFAAEFAFRVDSAIISGTGAGQPLGILASPALVTVAKETGQAAATLVSENVVKMYARMSASDAANAVWLISQDALPQLYSMSLIGGISSTPLFLPAGGWSGVPYNTLLGRPILVTEQCSPVGTLGDIVFANLGRYLWADKPMESAISIHVRFIYDESTFRFVYRCDGQPEINSPVTPSNNGPTLSPFVALAARA